MLCLRNHTPLSRVATASGQPALSPTADCPRVDIVITHDFQPKIGGAHHWLYEVYRRWPLPVSLLTEFGPPNHSANDLATPSDAKLNIVRGLAPIDDINVLSLACLRHYYHNFRLAVRVTGRRHVMSHCLRAFPEGALGLLLKMRGGSSARLITYAHGEEILIAHTSRQLRLLAQQVYRHSDLVIANSENTRRLVRELCSDATVACIHPGVDVAAFTRPDADAKKYRAQLGWPADTFIVSTVARMEARKNHTTVIQAVSELRKQGIPAAYICGGEGEEKERLVALARSLCVQEWIRFPGRVTEQEKKWIYGVSDVCAMPSVRVGAMIEGFGIVFLEAAAAGIPSICGRDGGQPEAVIDGKTGFVVDGDSLPAVCQAIRLLAADPDLRSRMGRDARAWAATHDWQEVVTRTLKALAPFAGNCSPSQRVATPVSQTGTV